MKKLAFVCLIVAACGKSSSAPKGPQTHVDIAVTEDGFSPAEFIVPAGTPVTLVFDRKTEKTCATEVVIHVDDTNTIEKDLPLNQPVEVAVTFPKAGKAGFACAMDMEHGTITVQ